MGLISPQQVSPGASVKSSDVNNPINTIANEFNGNIDNSNIKAGAAIDGSKLAAGSIPNAQLAQNVPWTSWTPTWTNLTVGNGTVVAKYQQIGKTVIFRLMFTFGSTSSIAGAVRFTMPVTSVDYVTSYGIALGICNFWDTSAATVFYGSPNWINSTTIETVVHRSDTINSSSGGLAAGNPMTWAIGDVLGASGTYEAV